MDNSELNISTAAPHLKLYYCPVSDVHTRGATRGPSLNVVNMNRCYQQHLTSFIVYRQELKDGVLRRFKTVS